MIAIAIATRRNKMIHIIESMKTHIVIISILLSIVIISPFGWMISLSGVAICLKAMDNPLLGIISIAIVNGLALGNVLTFTKRK